MSSQCETTARRAAGAQMPFFERYLSLWVALCIVAGIALGHFMPGFFESPGRDGDRQRQPAGCRADLADDPAHAAEDRLPFAGRGAPALERRGRDAVHQLGSQAFLDGAAGLDLHPQPVCGLAAGGAAR